MSLQSLISFFISLILAFTVLSAGQAKLTGRITPEIHEDQVAKDTEESSLELYLPFSPAARRKLRGVLDVIWGILLLWPSSRRVGVALSFFLLLVGSVFRIKDGKSLVPPLTMMVLCAVVWFLWPGGRMMLVIAHCRVQVHSRSDLVPCSFKATDANTNRLIVAC